MHVSGIDKILSSNKRVKSNPPRHSRAQGPNESSIGRGQLLDMLSGDQGRGPSPHPLVVEVGELKTRSRWPKKTTFSS